VLADASLDIDGQKRDADPDIGADEFLATANFGALTTNVALAAEPAADGLLTLTSSVGMALNEESLTADQNAKATLRESTETLPQTDEPGLIDLLAEQMAGNLASLGCDGDAEPVSTATALAEVMDALWAEFDYAR
jgi:hypothetical protein